MISSNPITVNGQRLDTYAFNIETKTGWASSPATRGSNAVVPGRSGSIVQKNKTRQDGEFSLRMWISSDTSSPTAPEPNLSPDTRYLRWRENYDRLLSIFDSTYGLLDVRQTYPGGRVRQAICEMNGATDPAMFGSLYGRVSIVLSIPGVYWRDLGVVGDASVSGGAAALNGNVNMAVFAGMTAPLDNAILEVNGPTTNPRFTDTRTGHYVELRRELPANSTWRLDCGTMRSTYNPTAAFDPAAAVSVTADTVAVGAHLPRLFTVSPPLVYGGAPEVRVTSTNTAGGVARIMGRRHFL